MLGAAMNKSRDMIQKTKNPNTQVGQQWVHIDVSASAYRMSTLWELFFIIQKNIND